MMRSATELAAAMRRGKLGPVEAIETHIERIERLDPLVNAVVVRCFERARQEARAAERALLAGEDVGPLHGVPITVKEAVEVEGLPFTNGSRLDAGRLGSVDAPAVRGLRAAGAIVLGKTNIPEFCPGGKMTLCTWPTAFGLPAVSVPAGRDETGMPLAVQVFGRRGHDLEVLGVASELEEALGGWIDPAQSPSGVLRGQAP